MKATNNPEKDKRIELKRKFKLERSFKRDIKKFLNNIARDNFLLFSVANESVNVFNYNQNLQDVLLKNYKKIEKEFSSDLRKSEKIDSQSVDNLIERTLESDNISTASLAADQILKTTQKKINQFTQKHVGTDQNNVVVAKKVRKDLESDNNGRSEIIAITEVQEVSENSKQVEAITLVSVGAVVVKKRWNSVFSPTTRDAHALANGQIVPVGGVFMVGGELFRFPGDRGLGASPRNYMNCHCFITHVV